MTFRTDEDSNGNITDCNLTVMFFVSLPTRALNNHKETVIGGFDQSLHISSSKPIYGRRC